MCLVLFTHIFGIQGIQIQSRAHMWGIDVYRLRLTRLIQICEHVSVSIEVTAWHEHMSECKCVYVQAFVCKMLEYVFADNSFCDIKYELMCLVR